MLKAYKYRLLPSLNQQEQLSKFFGCSRFVYNLGLETKISAYIGNKKNLTCFDLHKQLTILKNNEAKWLSDAPSQMLQMSLRNLDNAYTNFFRGKGFPRFKKKNHYQSIQFPQNVRICANKIHLPKLGYVDFVKHRETGEGAIKTVTVSKTTTGKYFVSVLIDNYIHLPEKKAIKDKTTIGIDVGLKTFAMLSDGQQFENPKYLNHQLKRLRIEQRTMDRRYKKNIKTELQSKNWHKQKQIVALLHEKIANQRKDFLHKTSTAIIKQYDTVCLENLNINGMAKNRSLSKAISDVSWGAFKKMLEYKAEWYGKNIVTIGRFEPSSKICSNCGHIYKELKLSERTWICQKCESVHDRDMNAAVNIKKYGLRNKPEIAKVSR